MTDDEDLIPAATVLLVRDPVAAPTAPAAGPEVLMLRRNSGIAFGGMWVFPGGRVDKAESDVDDPVGSARRAAVREVMEETGLEIEASALLAWSYWIPPLLPSMKTRGPRRRFSTWFFVAEAPHGEVAIDHGEIREHRWLAAETAHRQHRAGDIELAPPTWMTLNQLGRHRSVADILAWASATEPAEFRTRPVRRQPPVLTWAGDSAYETGDLEQPGPRNRLIMERDGWRYESTLAG